VHLSSCDWPGELVATVFCQGCPWRCRYCHNPHLLPADAPGRITWPAVMRFLHQRVGLLDGVVFSGGEPTLQPALGAAMRDVRATGLRVGLHTAGPFPDRLAEVLPLVDWVGFDVKAPFDRYECVTGVPGSGSRSRESLERLLASGTAYEVRTTVHPLLLGESALAELGDALATMGVEHYAVQAFRSAGCQDDSLNRGVGAVPPRLPEPVMRRLANVVRR
jgi:pyruvate formate lyase activating enzyme